MSLAQRIRELRRRH